MYPCVSMCGACAKCKCACEYHWGYDLWQSLTPDIAATDTSLLVGPHMHVSSGDIRVQGSATIDLQKAWSRMALVGGCSGRGSGAMVSQVVPTLTIIIRAMTSKHVWPGRAAELQPWLPRHIGQGELVGHRLQGHGVCTRGLVYSVQDLAVA